MHVALSPWAAALRPARRLKQEVQIVAKKNWTLVQNP
jgi:hypothetical protein